MSKSPSLRRIQADIRELSIEPSDQYTASPLEHDMFEWHFTIRGAPGTDFEGGVYHGRILLPPEYPFKPPSILFLTPSGRFETNTKVCLSFSSFHPELWQPAWGIRLILEALISFLPAPADGAIGALDWRKDERMKLAKESVKFRCPVCCDLGKTCVDLLPALKPRKQEEGTKTKFHEEIEKLKMLQFQNHAVEKEEEQAVNMEANNGADHPTTSQNSGGAKEETNVPSSIDNELSRVTELDTNSKASTNDEQHSNNVSSPLDTNRPEQTNSAAEAASTGETNVTPSPPSPVVPSDNTVNNNQTVQSREIEQTPLVSDSLLNGMIAALAIVVMMLLNEAHDLVDELRNLDH